MEKLNELVELAKKADREVTWSLLPFDMAKEGWCVEVVDYIAAMNPHEVLAIAEAYSALKQRAETTEAKLAESEKQEPIGMVTGKLGAGLRVSCYFMPDAVHLGTEMFTRPAPAVSLADLVPECFINAVTALESLYRNGQKQSWNERYTKDMAYASGVISACRAAILRNIEEANK